MRPSNDYIALRTRLSHLLRYLPSAAPTQTTFTQEEMDGLSTYAVLACAACEDFLEQRCLQVAKHAQTQFMTRTKLTKAATSLLALKFSKKDAVSRRDVIFNQGYVRVLISAKDLIAYRADILAELQACVSHFETEYIKANHGINSKYMTSLLAPIGFMLGEVDPGLRSKVDRLAKMRGDAAHQRAIQSTMLVHPSILIAEAASMEAGFEDLDKKLTVHARR